MHLDGKVAMIDGRSRRGGRKVQRRLLKVFKKYGVFNGRFSGRSPTPSPSPSRQGESTGIYAGHPRTHSDTNRVRVNHRLLN